jgi:restriction system protein
MTIPDFQNIMLPLLQYSSDGKEHSNTEVREHLAEHFKIPADERRQLLKSGTRVFDNRVSWAKVYLEKACLLRATGKGVFEITAPGMQVLDSKPDNIDIRYLRDKCPELNEFLKKRVQPKDQTKVTEKTALEIIEDGYNEIRNDLAQELLERISECPPSFFEKLVVDLLTSMGYGGSREEAGKAVGKSGDGGIDGVINEDRLGLDNLYIQAKRWKEEATVGRPEIQKFVGALHGKRARKGVFITTTKFTKEAIQYASSIENRVILIDGEQLAELMIDFGVGVSDLAVYEVKRIDLDYFAEE